MRSTGRTRKHERVSPGKQELLLSGQARLALNRACGASIENPISGRGLARHEPWQPRPRDLSRRRRRQLSLKTLDETCSKTGWAVHAYVLMGNHYHALLEIPEANLFDGMKWFLGTCTQRFNSRHRVFGHLFQGRYRALVIDGAQDGYFQTVSTYIHLNPARAGKLREFLERLGAACDEEPSLK